MEVRTVHHCLAHTVALCYQIQSFPTIINSTSDLRVTVQFPVMAMKSSGLHHPLAVEVLSMETTAPSPVLGILELIQTTHTVSGPSLPLQEGLSPSTFTLSALMILETVSRTILYSMMGRILILHPLDHIVEQTLT